MKIKKMLAYIKSKQFYYALFACLATIFLIGLIVWQNPQEQETDIADLNDSVSEDVESEETSDNLVDNTVNSTDTEGEVVETVAIGGEPTDSEEVSNTQEEEVVKAEPIPEVEEVIVLQPTRSNITFSESDRMIWPISGSVLLGYSMEAPKHFPTLDQYKVNPAIYISGNVGDKIKVAAEGIIDSVEYTEETGTTVTVYHGNGWKSIYGQLSEDLEIGEGDYVKKGQVIGKLEKPTSYHKLLDNHLYFKVIKDDAPYNPEDIIE